MITDICKLTFSSRWGKTAFLCAPNCKISSLLNLNTFPLDRLCKQKQDSFTDKSINATRRMAKKKKKKQKA